MEYDQYYSRLEEILSSELGAREAVSALADLCGEYKPHAIWDELKRLDADYEGDYQQGREYFLSAIAKHSPGRDVDSIVFELAQEEGRTGIAYVVNMQYGQGYAEGLEEQENFDCDYVAGGRAGSRIFCRKYGIWR